MFEGYVPTESEEQITVCQWAEVASFGDPRLELLYHVPNGGWRHPATAARMKAEGVKAGVPDLVLPVAAQGYHGLYIEMKVRDHSNRASKDQKRFMDGLIREGYKAVVCFGADEAIEVLMDYLGSEK